MATGLTSFNNSTSSRNLRYTWPGFLSISTALISSQIVSLLHLNWHRSKIRIAALVELSAYTSVKFLYQQCQPSVSCGVTIQFEQKWSSNQWVFRQPNRGAWPLCRGPDVSANLRKGTEGTVHSFFSIAENNDTSFSTIKKRHRNNYTSLFLR